ncbi:class I SAM-dependent methyltransferase [Thalassospira lucentensis]|uniref:class I SAM-dependent methyltransferase n=1 Tax=Thalassospira lucentensis TaxID=168935 RepID=UPI003D2F3C78
MMSERNDAAHFDARAARYETEIGEDYPQWLKWHLLQKYSQSGSLVADIGGASGRHAVNLAESGRKVYSLDLSEGMLRQMQKLPAWKKLPASNRPHAVVCRGQDLPISDSSFDLCCCFATLLLMSDQTQAIRELVRIARPGGYVILDVGMRFNIGWLYWRRFYRKQGFSGIYPLSMQQVTNLASTMNCDIVENVATGMLSQMLYIPFLEQHTPLRKWIHKEGDHPDLDGRCTRLFPMFANRRYIVLKRAME